MFRSLSAKKTPRKQRKLFPFLNEKGNMLVFYVLMMPVFLGAVGLAVDTANIAAVRTSLQLSADAATQGAVAASPDQPGGIPRYPDAYSAEQRAIQIYDNNRFGMSQSKGAQNPIPLLKCQTSATGGGTLIIPSTSHCGFTITNFQYNPSGPTNGYLTMTVQEKANTIFLQVLGFKDLTYTITSTARLTNTYN